MEDPPSPKKRPPPQFVNLPVDSDGKATLFRPFSPPSPHTVAFHLAWLSLFSCFFSTFSIPPLIPIIRQDLHLTDADIARAGTASFAGSMFSRLAMGPACDLVGPRVASATLSLVTAPIVLSASLVSSARSFVLVRFLVGFCLANFVANQFWMSSMFSGPVVGLANGVSAGWANTGSGVAQLLMPLVFTTITSLLGVTASAAWRLAFILPSLLQVLTAVLVLVYGQDCPSGSYRELMKKSRTEHQPEEKFFRVLFNGLKDYRGWILGLTYGFCFGVELTTDNVIAEYFYDRFGVNLEVAGTIAACFGMANLFSRPMGGVVSDEMGRRYGMRGRIWALWAVQMVAGLLCVLLGRVNSLWGSVLVMCVFSVFVQAASGLTFGVVPFVSKRSLGVISGMTGSGGTVGAVVTQYTLFSGSNFTKQTSISLMGLLMILCTLPISLMYFPQSGGMFCGPAFDPDEPLYPGGGHYRLLK